MKPDWPEVAIAEVCELTVDCVNRTAPLSPVPTPYKMIRTTNVRDGWIDTESVRYVDEATFRRWTRRGAPQRYDVILTREAPLGEVGMLRSSEPVFLGQRTYMYRADPAKLNSAFLLYSMLDDFMQGQIRACGSGSTVEHMRLPDCERLRLRLPPLNTQSKIAAILSAYDDLLDNNRRRIKALEEIAQRIYGEWFVSFRYPGHEHVSLVESDAGQIPDGWKVTTLGAAADWFSGGTPRTGVQQYWGGPIPWITSGCLTTHYLSSSDRTLTEEGVHIGSRLVPRDSILFVVRGMSLAKEFRVGIAECALAFGQDCKALTIHDGLPPLYVLHSLINKAPQIAKMVEFAAHGTGKISTDRLMAIPIVLPTGELRHRFSRIAEDVRCQVRLLTSSNSILSRARDLLLPRLISGDIAVDDLDIAVEDAVA